MSLRKLAGFVTRQARFSSGIGLLCRLKLIRQPGHNVTSQKTDRPLSAEQIECFRADGYVVVPGLFATDEMTEIAAWVDDVQNRPETPHQDVQAGRSGYAALHITALVTIDPATIENGCLEIAAHVKTEELISGEWAPLTEEDLDEVEFVSIEANLGDAVFVGSIIPHKTAPNLSSSARRVLYYTYNKASEGDHLLQYCADKRAGYPPDIEREAGQHYEYLV